MFKWLAKLTEATTPAALAFPLPPKPLFMREALRSPHWSTVRKKHLEAHPTCASCGGETDLEVHHMRPFHLHPLLELEPGNLITLCESSARHCHFRVGHEYDWKAYNPNVRMDAERDLERVKRRRYE